jgi:hypothetical protein
MDKIEQMRQDIIDSVFDVTLERDYNKALLHSMVQALDVCGFGQLAKYRNVHKDKVAEACFDIFQKTPVEFLDRMCSLLEMQYWDTGYDSC